jgi:hypothetical protein
MNLIDFIDYIIKFNNIDDILDTYNTQSEKGFVFERLFDIIIKFGFCDIFTNYYHLIGNVNNGKFKILKNINKYLTNENVISGNSTGVSDITLKNKYDDTFIFISSKYPKSDDKNINYYDIQNIIAVINNNKHIYIKFKIYLIVSTKNKVLKKFKNAKDTSKYISKYINEDNILDKEDLNKYFLNFKLDIIKNKNNNWNDIYFSKKENLNLRFHQELIIQKTSNLIDKGNKSFLWGCKCRSGKTYMIGGIILKLNIKNILIITPAPTETLPQFTDELFEKFKDFDKFKIHTIESSKKLKSIELNNNNIFVISKQLLQKYINEETIIKIKNLKLDIIAFDENHFTGTTNLSKDILTSYSSNNTVRIYLTATFNKPLKEWNILPECQLYWDIEDEQFCKKLLIDKLIEKHGVIVNDIIKYKNISDIYQNMPDLCLITTMFDNERYEYIKNIIKDSVYGFSFDALFSIINNKFQYEREIKIILQYISGDFKEINYPGNDKSIFGRINKIKTRPIKTQLWFLPPNNINDISKKLKILMLNDNVLNKYDIIIINSKVDRLPKDIKDEIIRKEMIANEDNKEGIIILVGNMLSLGITLDNCDLVMLLNNSLSCDKIMQQMYRCMTEGENKKYGFVVDLNISRVLNTVISYNNKNLTIEDKLKYLIENHLINIDIDMFVNKELNSNKLINKILDLWKDDPINNFKNLLRNLDNEYIYVDNDTQKLINKSFMSKINDKNNLTIEINNELQNIPDGVEKIKLEESEKIEKSEESEKIEKSEESEKIGKSEESEKIINISFTKDVLPFIIPLTCILTMKDNNKDFIKMLNDIQENNELLDIFNDQSLIWWNQKDLIKIIIKIINRYFNKESNTYNICINFKLSLQSLIDKPKKLLELINECLKPKDIEKKQFGEVFTPMDFINNMLKDLEDYWTNTYNENIYTNKKLNWYDPAAGMGNYPIAIYYKLMEGLKNIIPNEQLRKKHIIEKQLYMSELNKKNCFIIKKIFDINNEYKLNLYEGDSLNIELNEIFKINIFDIIIGNPPYNEELTKVGAKPLYNKFIEYYINKCKILSFIVPSRWFAGGKGLDNFRKMMINRTDILFIKHFDDASKIFGNLVEIKGGVNYFLINKEYNGLCEYNGSHVKFSNFDIILDSKYYNIVNKLLNYDKIIKYYKSQDYYKIQTNDKRLMNEYKTNYLKCYVSQQKGFIKYINKNEITKLTNNYKIITTRASFSNNSGFGNTFIGYPYEIHTKSYISFNLNSEIEAISLLSYMKCKLPNFMLSLRKISQDISESTCKWIPLLPLNKEWNNEKVYKYFKLSEDEIELIKNTKIIGYKD